MYGVITHPYIQADRRARRGLYSFCKDKWRTLLAPTLVKFLGTNDYFVGNKLSAFDFLMCKPLGNASFMGVLEEFPTLMAHYETIQQRSTHALAYEFHEKPMENAIQSLVMVPSK